MAGGYSADNTTNTSVPVSVGGNGLNLSFGPAPSASAPLQASTYLIAAVAGVFLTALAALWLVIRKK